MYCGSYQPVFQSETNEIFQLEWFKECLYTKKPTQRTGEGEGTQQKVQELLLAAVVSINPKGYGAGETTGTQKRKSHREGYLKGSPDLSWDTANPQGRNQRNKYSELNLTVFDLPVFHTGCTQSETRSHRCPWT